MLHNFVENKWLYNVIFFIQDRYLSDEDLPLSTRSRNSKYGPVVNVGKSDRGYTDQFTGKVSSRGR